MPNRHCQVLVGMLGVIVLHGYAAMLFLRDRRVWVFLRRWKTSKFWLNEFDMV